MIPDTRGLWAGPLAWVLLGIRPRAHGCCKGRYSWVIPGVNCDLPAASVCRASIASLGVTVSDLLYVGLTIVVFAVLLLILKGVERIER